MEIAALRAELQHIAQDRDASAARPHIGMAEQAQRGAHRGRVGIVAFIDQERRAACRFENAASAPPARRLQFGKC